MAKDKKSKKDKGPYVPEVSKSLAVRKRPTTLKTLVGQDHIVAQIKGMYKTRRWSASFLLEGQTGGGKTTVARIIATMLNCETGKACGTCSSCMMGTKNHPDIITINAGTDGKVDDIRKLVKGSHVAPMFNKRVIIIDEAHKLTGASAEAILVPLEEPSQNTVFILCTTEPEKLKDTVKNRCTRFTMKPIKADDIVKRLSVIAKEEGHNIGKMEGGKEALNLIADFTNGSMREAISLLESVLFAAEGDADISNKDVLAAFVQNSEVDLDKAAVSLIAALLNKDMPSAVRIVRVAGNVRGLLSKSMWLVDYLIGSKTKSAKFKPYSGRLFETTAEKHDITVKLSDLMPLQVRLVETELALNSTSTNESLLIQTAVFKYAADNNKPKKKKKDK
jgi:DNA polymerase III subunit gamma/tau